MNYQVVNRRGIALVTSQSITVGTDNVVISFPPHSFAGAWYKGKVVINIAQAIPTGTTGTLPIVFETNGVQVPLTTYGGDAVTVTDIAGTGYYDVFYDKSTNLLQLMN